MVATLNEATRRLGDFELGPVSLQVDAGDRIGITGPNGAGKLTLLRLLLGRDAHDSCSASLGASVAVGHHRPGGPGPVSTTTRPWVTRSRPSCQR